MPTKDAAERIRFPYFPFFVDDWLSSDAIAGFTLEQEAAYLRLLLRQWKAPDGYLTDDERLLAVYSRLGSRWAKVGRPILARCFQKRVDGYVNVRLRAEWLQVRKRSELAKVAANKRWNGEE